MGALPLVRVTAVTTSARFPVTPSGVAGPGSSEPRSAIMDQPNMWAYGAVERQRAFEEHQSFLWEGGDFTAEQSAP